MTNQTKNCSKCNEPLDKAGNCPRCVQLQKALVHQLQVIESSELEKDDEEIEF